MEEEYLPTHKRKPWCLHVSQHVLKIGNEELSLSLSLSLSPSPSLSLSARARSRVCVPLCLSLTLSLFGFARCERCPVVTESPVKERYGDARAAAPRRAELARSHVGAAARNGDARTRLAVSVPRIMISVS